MSGQDIVEGKEPGLLDDSGEEHAQLSLDSADEALVYGLGGPCMFGLDANGLRGVGGDGGVIGVKPRLDAVEGMTISSEIVGRGVDETGEAFVASRDVDRLEEVGEELANLLQVVVGRGDNDGWQFGGCIRDDELGLLWCCHSADREG